MCHFNYISACNQRIPAFHQYYSLHKEKIGDAVNARTPFLQISEGRTTDVLENVCRKANMEKRMVNNVLLAP